MTIYMYISRNLTSRTSSETHTVDYNSLFPLRLSGIERGTNHEHTWVSDVDRKMSLD